MIAGYDFELRGGDAAAADEQIEDVDGVEVSLRAGLVSVAYGPEEQLRAAWRILEILARAGYAIEDLQRGRPVDVDEDFDDVLQTYEAMQRLPGR